MDFKTFMQSVEQEIDKFQSEEELKKWLENYARTIKKEMREDFLEQFRNREQSSHEGQLSHERQLSHEEHPSRPKRPTHEKYLQDVIDFCEEINASELTLTCSGHEEYGEYYWAEDWVYEYEDPMGIGETIEHYYDMAEQCVYDKDYETASHIYWNIGAICVLAEDDDGGDPVDLEIEDLVSESIVSLDLKHIAALTLYSTYQASKPSERASKLYEYFSWGMFDEVKLEDMMSAGREPLEGIEEFMDSWIVYLRGQQDKYTSRLLIEAVIYRYGTDGLLEEAKRCVNQHPQLFIDVLEKYYSAGLWEKLYEEGKEALRLMNCNMLIRGRAARLTASGARGVGNEEGIKNACFEAFRTESTVANYLKLITCAGITEEEKKAALECVESAKEAAGKENSREVGYSYSASIVKNDLDPYAFSMHDYLDIQFFAQNYGAILKKCKTQKEALGWSGKYISQGVSLLLMLLSKDDVYRPAMQAILREVQSYIVYKNEYNEPDLSDVIDVWKKQIVIDEKLAAEILEYLQKTIDARIDAIVSGTHRGSYHKAAQLGAALGEVEESIGIPQAKVKRIQKYLKQFPRHRAFKEEMQAYM